MGCVAAGTLATVYTLKSTVKAAATDQSSHWMTEPVTDLKTLEQVKYLLVILPKMSLQYCDSVAPNAIFSKRKKRIAFNILYHF